jgi:hypothetical protein
VNAIVIEVVRLAAVTRDERRDHQRDLHAGSVAGGAGARMAADSSVNRY